MELQASNTRAILVLTQMVSLLSLLFWASIMVIIVKNNAEFSSAGLSFAIYPALPLMLSIGAWMLLRIRRFRAAVICSTIPATVSLALMVYFYIIGVSQH